MSVKDHPSVAIYAGNSPVSCPLTKSIEQQVRRCWDYCDKRRWGVQHIFIDQNRTESLVERRNFQNMIEEARAGSIDHIVFYGLRYFCESAADLAVAEKFLQTSGIPFHSAGKTKIVAPMLPCEKRKAK